MWWLDFSSAAKIITSRRMEFHKDIGGKKTTKNELSTDSRFS
jgi:hypothetical protein